MGRILDGYDVSRMINTGDTRDTGDLYPRLDEENVVTFMSRGNHKITKTTERRINNNSYTKSQVRMFVNNPRIFKKQLQIVSEELYSKSGHYFRTITHFSNIFRLDHYLYSKDLVMPPTIDNYVEAGNLIDSFNIRKQIPNIFKELLLYGEVYLYKSLTNNGKYNELVVLPKDYCEVCQIKDGIKRFEIRPLDMPPELRRSLPRGVLRGWDGETNIHRVDDNGVAFLSGDIDREGYPMLLFMFDAVLSLDESKDLSDLRDGIDMFSLIHMGIPLDDDKKEITISPQQVKSFHDAIADRLPSEVRLATTPLELDSIEIKRPGELDIDVVEKANRNIWQDSGLSETLFGSRFTGAEAARQSLISDSLVVIPLLEQVLEYLNWELRYSNFNLKILHTTHFNHANYVSEAKTAVDSGGSRLAYLATTGRDPLEAVGLLKFEQTVLDIDSIMKPKQTAYTLSNKDNVDAGGRPTEQDKINKGEEVVEPKSSNPDKEALYE